MSYKFGRRFKPFKGIVKECQICHMALPLSEIGISQHFALHVRRKDITFEERHEIESKLCPNMTEAIRKAKEANDV